jgi:hypothetical protein
MSAPLTFSGGGSNLHNVNSNFIKAMGEWERKSQAKPHVQRTDLSVTDTAAASGGGPGTTTVRCIKRSADFDVPFGAPVRLVDRKRPLVEVFLAGRCVGDVCEEDTVLLRGKFGIETRPGSSLGGQCSTSEAGAEFNVSLD